jgi:hypothetical protein
MNRIEFRTPIDAAAGKMLDSRRDVDYSHPNFNDAMRICDVLKGCGLLRKGIPYDEAVRLLINILGKREVVITEVKEDKDRIAIEKQKIDIKRAEIDAKNARMNIERDAMKLRKIRLENEKQWAQIFVNIAKETMNVSEFMALRDMADELFRKNGGAK